MTPQDVKFLKDVLSDLKHTANDVESAQAVMCLTDEQDYFMDMLSLKVDDAINHLKALLGDEI